MCLIDSNMFINSNQYQKFATFFMFDKLELDMILEIKFNKVLLYLIRNSNVKDHYKIPLLNGFSGFLWEKFLCIFPEK
jgi:hypothetical protein